ncbi:DUF3108 domain-containing protein [bacterium]|nr:DUF3108 domain-containing protein [bacterium]MBU1074011.1 DUF3108 domain-containing protein [bacterium]MBU1675559.1 DUF3108 domain-containing protein [bacterium]
MNGLLRIVTFLGCWLVPAGASVAMGALAATDSAVSDPKPAYARVPYAPGEFLLFSIDYGPVNAGEASLEVRDMVESDGRLCYRVESKAISNRFFSAFYMVRDKVVSHIDAETLFSRYFSKRLREGDYRKNIAIRFDHEAGVAHYADRRELEIPFGVHDILSAFYFVRTMDLQPGASAFIHTHSSHKNYDLEVIVHGRETVSVPAGTFDCFKVEPIILGEGLFQFEGKLTIWLTADERRLPVLMKTKVKVGAIDASLKEFTMGETLPEAGPR